MADVRVSPFLRFFYNQQEMNYSEVIFIGIFTLCRFFLARK